MHQATQCAAASSLWFLLLPILPLLLQEPFGFVSSEVAGLGFDFSVLDSERGYGSIALWR